MRTRNLLLMILAFVIAAAGCKKGDTGSAGPQGPKGDTGNIGATGADGTKIFSGQGAPAATLGRNGDFYVDLSTSNMYGPKADAGWGTPYSLKGVNGTIGTNGTNGANGNPGSKIYSGTGAPNNSTGIAGDYFMSTDTYLFYGPKTDAGWGIPVNLKGPKGDKGDPGNAGAIATPWIKLKQYSYDRTTLRLFENLPLKAFGIANLDELREKGIILVYSEPSLLLPYSFTYHSGAQSYSVDVWYSLELINNVPSVMISFQTSNRDSEDIAIFDFHNSRYRIVYIPISQISASANNKQIQLNNLLYSQQQLRAMSYAQVTQLFNLKN